MKNIPSPPLLFRLAAMLAVALLITSLAFSAVWAANGYEVSWYTIDGGGGSSSGGNYLVMGSIGQPDAGSQSGSGHGLTGGFWSWLEGLLYNYLPLIKKP
ncbi:MAG: hypothetical protein JW704_05185 [Anaerolineaceae bacterium]|mgnify:CR=1 FL=1|nr:hypothetical protein [Anaerolineaceae bacterium]MBN2677506.1 hypothetical protein [Anaerolineaceae bacterium]